jgi:2-polyprenyl-3-methyl-5-hydroxy-6-metoxy-1,4-benzoquinol methylase
MEVGPGSGIYLPLLADRFGTVIASDIENAYLTEAKKIAIIKPNIQIVSDDITRSLHKNESADFLLCSEVIEHISNSQDALREIARILKPGRIAIISTPQRYAPLELAGKIAFLPGFISLARIIYREPILSTGHINLLTEAGIRKQFEAAGLRAIESSKFGMYIPILAEFGGEAGLRLEKWIESAIQKTPWDWLLWTQCYAVERNS